MSGEGEGQGKVVCVTGASGYIASWLVKLLLQRGYTVKATVSNPNDPKKVDHLRALDGANERLHLYRGNLLEEGSFDAAVQDCDGVFHTASPVLHDVKDPQAELIDPAVKGTLNVLNSCAKTPSIKRVVLTSSMATVAYNRKLKTPEVVVDESWFSDPDLNKEMKMWYILSKILAEEAAWKFVKKKGIDMVTINPGVVLGPLLQPTLNFTTGLIAHLINEPKTYPNMAVGYVHVKDVATAHIQALEIPSANGRYNLAETVVHFADIVKLLKELYPNIALPGKCADDMPLDPTYQVSKEKTKCLGIMDYIPLKISIKETVESLQEKGFINFF